MIKWSGRILKTMISALLLLSGSGCSTLYWQPQSRQHLEPAFNAGTFTMDDGYVLPFKSWGPATDPRAVVVAVHGFNDYSNAFVTLGTYLTTHNVVTIAYDQRGFGATAYRGQWPGVPRLVDDLALVVHLVKHRYGTVPVYVLGESMGGALTLAAAGGRRLPGIESLILTAPAVWGRNVMPLYMRLALTISANTLPAMEVTGRGLKIMASDNRPMLVALSRDRAVIKSTRLDTISGLSDLMDAGLAAGPQVQLPVLLLFGDHDQVVPRQAVCALLSNRTTEQLQRWKALHFHDGYHLLTRDRQRINVLARIAEWIASGNVGQSSVAGETVDSAWCTAPDT